MSIEKLINHGFKSFNVTTGSKEKTIIVVGSARGGTSMIAGILYHLGIPMGTAVKPVFEDLRLASAFETQNKSRINSIITEYNNNPVWAFKRPGAINYLAQIADDVRNPHFVFIFRDVFSIAHRNGISMGSNLVDAMGNALNDYGKIIEFISENKYPYLMCSSEKVNAYPEKVVEALVEFSGVVASTKQVESAIRFIDPESTEYLNASRINRSHGQVGQVKNNIVVGWAAWFYRDEPVIVEVYLNNVLIAESEAVDLRSHLVELPKTRKGYCGYSINISHVDLKAGDELIVKVKSDVMQLKNSPWVI
jgi:hypothetical protein